MATIAGIDYSLTSPSICVTRNTEHFSFEECSFFFLTGKKKHDYKFLNGKIRGNLHYPYKCEEERHHNISQWALDKVNHCTFIVIEDYAFAGKGKVFNIAENAGLLKHQLWRFQKSFITVPPSVIKKDASGKGNADKDMMYDAWIKETGCDLKKEFEQENTNSPVSDIVDSYFMAQYAHKYLRVNK